MKGARPLTPSEIQSVSQSFSGKYAVRDKCLFLLGINIGARVSELTALTVGDVWQHARPVDVLTLRKGIVNYRFARRLALRWAYGRVRKSLIQFR